MGEGQFVGVAICAFDDPLSDSTLPEMGSNSVLVDIRRMRLAAGSEVGPEDVLGRGVGFEVDRETSLLRLRVRRVVATEGRFLGGRLAREAGNSAVRGRRGKRLRETVKGRRGGQGNGDWGREAGVRPGKARVQGRYVLVTLA